MYIDQFKVFCDLAETESFSKAAALNGVTQSAVSQQVRGLEVKFNVTLVERGRRQFSLTPEGAVFLETSRRIVELYRDLGVRLQALRNKVTGRLRIATIYSIGLHELPPRLTAFRAKHPDVEVHVEYRRSEQVYHQVLDGSVDLGLVSCPAKRTGLLSEVFEEDEMVLICHPRHPFAKVRNLDVARLAGEKFISFEPDLPTRKVVDKYLRDHGVAVSHAMEFDNIETVKRAVEIESGVSIVPANTVRQEVAGGLLATVSLAGPRLCRPLGVIARRNRPRSPAEAEFFSLLRAGV